MCRIWHGKPKRWKNQGRQLYKRHISERPPDEAVINDIGELTPLLWGTWPSGCWAKPGRRSPPSASGTWHPLCGLTQTTRQKSAHTHTYTWHPLCAPSHTTHQRSADTHVHMTSTVWAISYHTPEICTHTHTHIYTHAHMTSTVWAMPYHTP